MVRSSGILMGRECNVRGVVRKGENGPQGHSIGGFRSPHLTRFFTLTTSAEFARFCDWSVYLG